MGIFVTIITVAFLSHWTYSLISVQWCNCMGGNAGICRPVRPLTSFRGRTRFRQFLMRHLSFKSNHNSFKKAQIVQSF